MFRDYAERGRQFKEEVKRVEGWISERVSSRQSAAALKDWLLGTQAAPACEAGAFIRGRLMTADRSRRSVFAGQA